MAWLLAIVVLVLLVASSGFRKFALGIVGVAVVGGGIYYLHHEHEEDLIKSRIPIKQVVISDGRIGLQYGTTYHFTGRITNTSTKYTLTQMDLSVSAKDCTGGNNPTCVVIGNAQETVFKDIPPLQARDFDESLYFHGDRVAPKGVLQWTYDITQTRAKL